MVEAGHDTGYMEWFGNIELPVPAQSNPFCGADRRTHQRERIEPQACGSPVAGCLELGIWHAEDDGVDAPLVVKAAVGGAVLLALRLGHAQVRAHHDGDCGQ